MTISLSIAVPTYNDSDTVLDTIQSVTSSTQDVDELIILDDASSDSTVELLSRNGAISRILVSDKNLGLVGNWNRCIDESRSDYLWILHSDDWLHPNAIGAVKYAISRYAPGIIFAGAAFAASPKEVPSNIADACPDEDSDWHLLEDPAETFAASLTAICSSVVVRRNLYSAYGKFSSNFAYSPDEELWPRLALHTSVLVRKKFPLTYVRTGGSHEMHSTWQRPDFDRNWITLHDQLRQFAMCLPVQQREAALEKVGIKMKNGLVYVNQWREANSKMRRHDNKLSFLRRSLEKWKKRML